MSYYKIIQNGNIIGAGCHFLRWFSRVGRFAICDMQVAECAKDIVTEQLFHADWLKRVPDGVTQPPDAEVVLIDEEEYEEIIEQLIDGEVIPIPDPEPEPEPEPTPEPEPEPEHKMTVQEMREKIAELTELVMSENAPFVAKQTYTKGEVIANGSRVYIASQVIVAGETVRPGVNCTETTIAEVLNLIQAQK